MSELGIQPSTAIGATPPVERSDREKSPGVDYVYRANNIAVGQGKSPDARRLQATYQSAAIGIAETDAHGRFTRVNEAMCSITGYARMDLLGQAVVDRLHPDEQEETQSVYERLVSGEIAAYEIDSRFLHKSGHQIWLAGTCTAVRDERGNFLFGVRIVRDETIRKVLFQFAEDLNAAASIDLVFDHALSAITGALRCDRASILLFDDANVMRFVSSRGLSPTYCRSVEGHSPWTPDTTNPSPIVVGDVQKSDLPSELKAVIQREGIGALAFFPLTIDGKTVGKFMAYFDAPHEFGSDENGPALTIARHLSLAIARHRAVQALEKSNARNLADVNALSRLNVASSRLWSCLTLADGLESILSGSIETMGAQMGNVQLLDPSGAVLRIVAQRGFKKPFLDFFAEVSADDQSACGRALRSGDRIIVSDIETDPGFAPMRHVAREAGFRAVQSTPLIGRHGVALGMLSTHFAVAHTPSEQDLHVLDLYARQAADFIERCRVEDALKQSEALERKRAAELKGIMESVPAAIWLAKDIACERIEGNRMAEQLLGLEPGRNHSLSAPNDERPTSFEIFSGGRKLDVSELPVQRAAQGEELRDFEMELRFSDGTARTLLGNATPLRAGDGRSSGSVAAFVDITERLRAESQRSVLMAELSHRVKNTLAVVLALWQHTCAKAENLEAAKMSFEARLLALSQTHTRLAEGDWNGVRLRTLIDDELRPYIREDAQNVIVNGRDMVLSGRAALTMGLALHELATNSAKHGSLSCSGGRVSILWDCANENFSLEWKEQDGPTVAQPTRRGFGRFLIERAISSDFQGHVDLDFNPSGLIFRMNVPLENVVATGEPRS